MLMMAGEKGNNMNIEAGKRYTMTRNVRGAYDRSFKVTVDWVEDRGDYWYIGYTPDDFRICRWGCCKVKKHGQFKTVNYTFEAA